MPLVNIDYVVSFSSEDPEHPARNLLLADVKSKWLCSAGEPSCSVVLQLKSACKIDSITVGAYHAAVVEVLGGLSEKPNDPFQVLVPSCVLLSPGASRRGDGVERVRTFGAAQLAAAGARRWDRVRLVCSQPYNKHCKYGLAFVHISSSEAPAPPAPRRALQLDAEAGSSDDEFRPGELFAKHQRARRAQSTDAQIRQASSQALKNNPDASTELTKASIARPSSKGQPPAGERHREPDSDAVPSGRRASDDDESTVNTSVHDNTTASQRKRKRAPETHPDLGPVCSSLSEVLAGVVVAMSGYVNPQRAALRAAALEMGARYLRDWEPACTHLICAFPNTPKLRSVRASNASTVAVGGAWLEQCRRRRRRLPWRWFAAEPQLRRPVPPEFDRAPADDRSGMLPEFDRAPADDRSEDDTDDEIEKVLKQQGKKRRDSSPDRTDTAPRSDQTHSASGCGQADGGRDHVDGFNHKNTDRSDSRGHTDSINSHGHTDSTNSHGHTDSTNSHGHTDRTSTHGHTDDADEASCNKTGGSRKSSTDADDTLSYRPMDGSRDSDVAFVHDERVQAEISLHSDSDATDEDERAHHPDSVQIEQELPQLWAGCTFVLSRLQQGAAALLTRYIRAYGGLVLKECEVLEDSSVQYVVGEAEGESGASGACADARRVPPEWVWRRHARACHSPPM